MNNLQLTFAANISYSGLTYNIVYRLAIPTINDKGQKHYWYINNDGDSYKVNKTSKYFKKIHSILSTPQKPITQKLKTNTA